MELELKLCRFESAPWGFRLIGGADFDFPLTVVKIVEGGLAEQAGLRVDDTIIKINDEPTSKMSHDEVHQLISHCGNNFFLTVFREEITEPDIDITESENELETIIEVLQNESKTEEEIPQQCSPLPVGVPDEQNQTNDFPEEEKIAEMISAEAEVLKEHNVIGVNFNRIFPKSGICHSSEVFRTLNEEAIKTRAEMEKEKRKWTTFMQKPDRPIPKTKAEIEREKAEHYRVQIIKQSKPKIAPDFVPSPEAEKPKEEKAAEIESDTKTEEPVQEDLEEINCPSPMESEMPNLEPIGVQNAGSTQKTELESVPEENEEATETEKIEEETAPTVEEPDEKTEDDQTQPVVDEMVEKQLSEIQKQLKALAVLPSTIQATLDAVTKQLSELLPNNVNIEEVPKSEPQTEEVENGNAGVIDIELSETKDVVENETEQDAEVIEEFHNGHMMQENMFETESIDLSEKSNESIQLIENENESEAQEFRSQHSEEKIDIAKQKDSVIEELQKKQRMLEKRMSKTSSKSVFGGLTPQERPLVLPGGRKWRRPKDAYNDEFIAEVISSQAELIVGSTLGVNFFKYKKPEKHIDLEQSEVYKIIHNLDRSPKCGIELRPPKVAAADDIRDVSG